jgi:hypothetical protein
MECGGLPPLFSRCASPRGNRRAKGGGAGAPHSICLDERLRRMDAAAMAHQKNASRMLALLLPQITRYMECGGLPPLCPRCASARGKRREKGSGARAPHSICLNERLRRMDAAAMAHQKNSSRMLALLSAWNSGRRFAAAPRTATRARISIPNLPGEPGRNRPSLPPDTSWRPICTSRRPSL